MPGMAKSIINFFTYKAPSNSEFELLEDATEETLQENGTPARGDGAVTADSPKRPFSIDTWNARKNESHKGNDSGNSQNKYHPYPENRQK